MPAYPDIPSGEKRFLGVRMHPDLFRAMKIRCLETEETTTEMVLRLVEKELAKKSRT